MPDKIVHVSWLTAFNSCWLQWLNSKYEPKVVDTYKGDIGNVAVLSWSDAKVSPFVNWYVRHFNLDVSVRNKLAVIMKKMKQDIRDIKEANPIHYQECKFMIPYSKWIYASGTPDLFYFDVKDDIWSVDDYKVSTHNWYSNPEIIVADCQRILYPLWLMIYMWVDRCRFRFRVFDKNNTNLKLCGEHIITKKKAEKFFRDVMERYLECEFTWEYPAKRNPKCFFCPLKKSWLCPERQWSTDFEAEADF